MLRSAPKLSWLALVGSAVLLAGTVAYRHSHSSLFRFADKAALDDAVKSTHNIQDEQVQRLFKKIEGAKSLVDLGVVYTLGDSLWVDGKNVSHEGVLHTFDVANDHSTRVEILDTETSCGCAKAKLSSTLLEPGERAQLTLSISHDKLSDGPHNYWVKLRTKEHGTWLYSAKVDVLRAVAWHQNDIYFGDVSAASTDVELTPWLKVLQPPFLDEIKIESIKSSSNRVTVAPLAAEIATLENGFVEKNIPVKLLLHAPALLANEQKLGYVTVKYASEGKPYEAGVRLHWEKTSAYAVSPARIVLKSSSPPGEPIEVVVFHASRAPFRIVSCELPGFLVQEPTEEHVRAVEQKVTLSLAKDRLPDAHQFSTIVFKTDLNGENSVAIPVSFLKVEK